MRCVVLWLLYNINFIYQLGVCKDFRDFICCHCCSGKIYYRIYFWNMSKNIPINFIYKTKKGKIKRIGTKLLSFRESLKKKKQKTYENDKERLPEWA